MIGVPGEEKGKGVQNVCGEMMGKIFLNLGLPWWSSAEDSVLPLQGAQVLNLVRELLIKGD